MSCYYTLLILTIVITKVYVKLGETLFFRKTITPCDFIFQNTDFESSRQRDFHARGELRSLCTVADFYCPINAEYSRHLRRGVREYQMSRTLEIYMVR